MTSASEIEKVRSARIADPQTGEDAVASLPEDERERLNEMAKAIRTIAYGSIVLTIHEGRLVEISKTTRLRKSPAKC